MSAEVKVTLAMGSVDMVTGRCVVVPWVCWRKQQLGDSKDEL